jgi:hypothetical protein
LKLVIFLCSSTTYGEILHISTTFSFISSRYVTKMLEFVFLYFATVVCHNDSYSVTRHSSVL